MTSFDLATFEAAFPPTGTVAGRGAANGPYGAGAPTGAPGVDQQITVLNMSGKRATGLWTTDQERSHFTIEPTHIFNIHRSSTLPIRTIEISTGGAQPVYSNTRVMPLSTIAIVLNKDGGYSPLTPIDGGGNDDGGTTNNGNNNNGNSNGTTAAGAAATGYGASYRMSYTPDGAGYAAAYAAPANAGGYTSAGGSGYVARSGGASGGPLEAAYRALTNAATLSYSPFGWRV